MPVRFLVSGLVWFLSGEHEPDDLEHLVRYSYGRDLVESASVISEAMETISGRPSRLKALISRYDDARVQFFAIAPNAKVHPDYIPFQAGLRPSEYEEAAD